MGPKTEHDSRNLHETDLQHHERGMKHSRGWPQSTQIAKVSRLAEGWHSNRLQHWQMGAPATRRLQTPEEIIENCKDTAS